MIRTLVNPSAGRGRGAATVERLRRDADVELLEPASAEELGKMAREAAARGDERVVVVGGDGTVNRVIAELAGTECALGLIPSGTGNDFARSLGLPIDPAAAAEIAVASSVRSTIDLGRVGDRPFGCVACTGFDGAVLEFVERRGLLPRGPWVYPISVLRALASYRAPRLTIEWDGGGFEGQILFAALANGPAFGGGMRVAPDASWDDGLLDLVIVEAMPRLSILAAMPRIYGGTHTGLASVQVHRIPAATLRCDEPLVVHGDGEPLARTGEGDVTVTSIPGALHVVTGPVAARLPR